MAIVLFATGVLATPWAHALAVLLNGIEPVDGALWARPLTLAALTLAIVAALGIRVPVRIRYAISGVAGVLCAALLVAWQPAAMLPALALIPVALGSTALAGGLAKRLPSNGFAATGRSRVRSGLWALAAVVAVVQLARLSTWMSDPEFDWFLSTRHPFWAKHECLSAYVHGAELSLRGEPNVYDAAHYPGLNPKAQPHSEVAGMVVEDPYQYAPQFLLWPAAALAVTQDYVTLRVLWFALQTTAFALLAVWLALWVGGRAGRMGIWLLPLGLSAFPVLHDLQYGQFHLAAVGLGVAAMLAIERGRERLGGALLAVATLSKLFPGLLLLLLLAQRRWRALGWTAAFGAALTLATLAVFGSAPFDAFVSYHLPRLQSGAAFAFGDVWPEARELLIVANHGVYGLVVKLAELGVPGLDGSVAAWINRAYAVLLGIAALAIGRRADRFGREQRAIVWLSLLGLASMMSTGAFADYVPATAIWLLTLLSYRMTRPAVALGLGTVWVSQYTLAFTTPIGEWFDAGVMIPLSALSVVVMLGMLAWSLRVALREQVTAPAMRHSPAWGLSASRAS